MEIRQNNTISSQPQNPIHNLQKKCFDYERFFNLSKDLLCIITKEGYFKLANNAFNILGFTNKELMAKKVIEFIHPEDRERAQRELLKRNGELPTLYTENRFRNKDGSYRWFGWTNITDKSTGYLYAIVHDLTEDKIIKDSLHQKDFELMQQNRDLINSLKARDEMMSFISHELKNSLSSFKLIVQLIQRLILKNPGMEAVKKSIDQLPPAIQKMQQLIVDILDITKLESGELKIILSEIDLLEVVKDVVNNQKLFAEEKHLNITFDIAEDARKVLCDQVRTSQILLNLVNNAIKFTNSGTINITAKRTDSHVEVQVQDSGIGISQENITHLFNRFWQANSSSTYSGTGLGLSIVKKLVELQKGKVWVESKVGIGTTFYFTLPLAPGALKHE